MNTTFKSPENCETMAEVRAGVDATDRALIDLLATRFGFMRAAARIKPERSHVRDEERKAAVIKAAMDEALNKGVPVGLIAEFWENLVETSIAYEMEEWDRIRS
ncbi:chorismate mutase [Croceicoccus gelatinilyticus]|uniref:chorismate mutase n=1 Tax=Croceicoccus gelatinilyticus TaxID=2835536 RepID=UPI001BCC0441|nr:chorismate mutase [Croceicoccus gelatinilyticus]MBS7671008.1 chorismate mutase [Croceicoccus gelatinilyticus]